MKNPAFLCLVLLPALLFSTTAVSAETLWIRPVIADLKSAPRMDSKSVAQLHRGTEVSVLEKQSLWYRVKAAGTEGYVARVLLSDHKPVGATDLGDGPDLSEGKKARVRVTPHSATMGVRGLSPDDRVREGREAYPSNLEALDDVEKKDVKGEDLDRFKGAARLESK